MPLADTKVDVDFGRDAPARVALEMAYFLASSIENQKDHKKAFLDLYAECLTAAKGYGKRETNTTY